MPRLICIPLDSESWVVIDDRGYRWRVRPNIDPPGLRVTSLDNDNRPRMPTVEGPDDDTAT